MQVWTSRAETTECCEVDVGGRHMTAALFGLRRSQRRHVHDGLCWMM